jgi:hydrogenase maturation protein HypF
MKFFGMCEACVLEYIEPSIRRYHAQPISCYECGPQLFFVDLEDKNCRYESDVIERAVKKLQDGKIIALKGLGGFHIICDATNKEAVESLRERKHRPSKPLAVMAASIEVMQEFAVLCESEISKLCSKERPIVVVSKKQNATLADAIAPKIDKIGLFLPYTPLHELLLEAFGKPIVATSANLSDEPIITDEKELLQKLSLVVDGVVTHDRDIRNACDDSVMMDVGGDALFLRLARGYAPKSFYHQKPINKKILAFGANQKSTVALSFGNNTILSPHIGDLNSIDAVNYFQETIATFERIYEFEPEIVVCDKHPNYESTKLAHAYVASHPNTELIELQHHYAHALAVMAEYGLEQEVLAFCFDGTGYGDDGTLWGGEVLRATPTEYSRLAHLQTLYLLGGEKAVREPRRVGLSLLFELFSFEELESLEHPLLKSFSPQELKTLHMMHTKGINRPASTSVGRLFDGVYALSGFLEELGYEGESGLILEKIAVQHPSDARYTFSIVDGLIGYTDMVREILQEKEPELIAAKFINTLCEIILSLAQQNRELPVVLCGGVFQNRVLVEKVKERFESESIAYYIAKETPVNDGAISLGQAYHVRKILEQKPKDSNE